MIFLGFFWNIFIRKLSIFQVEFEWMWLLSIVDYSIIISTFLYSFHFAQIFENLFCVYSFRVICFFNRNFNATIDLNFRPFHRFITLQSHERVRHIFHIFRWSTFWWYSFAKPFLDRKHWSWSRKLFTVDYFFLLLFSFFRLSAGSLTKICWLIFASFWIFFLVYLFFLNER